MEVTDKQRQDSLDKIKRMLEIDMTVPDLSESVSQQLEDFLDMAYQQLAVRLGFPEAFPDELSYIVINVTVRYFNLKGKEGTKQYTQEGESVTQLSSMLDGYLADIEAYLNTPRKPQRPTANFY